MNCNLKKIPSPLFYLVKIMRLLRRLYRAGRMYNAYVAFQYLVTVLRIKQSVRLNKGGPPIYLKQMGVSSRELFEQIFFTDRQYDQFQTREDPRVIIDGGGNVGFAAVFFANKYPHAKIFSIEPNSGNFKKLKRNTDKYPNIISLHKALSNLNDVPLLISNEPGLSDQAFMVTSKPEEQKYKQYETVRSINVPSIIEQYKISKIDILKIDIEGHEAELFSSNTEWLPLCEHIIIEFHDRMKPDTYQNFFREILKYDYEFLNPIADMLYFRKKYMAK